MSTAKANILLIYTGGTIGMIKDFRTGVLKTFDFKTLLEKIPELHLLDCNIDTVSFEKPIDSSNMNPLYWVQIAELIEDHYEAFDGFVVLHGSDTMSYTASALSFMLENLEKPVVFTGSQLPIGDLRTDAKENLITSIQMASFQENGIAVVKEVCLYFEYKLYRANRTTKLNAEHFQAFASYNYPELAESGVHLKINNDYLYKPNLKHKLKVHKSLNENIAVIRLFPGISETLLKSIFAAPKLKAVIIETYGSGNCTTEKWFLNILKEHIARGIHVINITQCLAGRVMMGRYETSSALKNLGVISGHDMTMEAAIAKSMFLLGEGVSHAKFKSAYEMDLRGELSHH